MNGTGDLFEPGAVVVALHSAGDKATSQKPSTTRTPVRPRESDRPNTLHGLVARRDELIKLRNNLEAEARKVTCDIDHLDAVIELFDPANAPATIKRYVTKHRAQKGRLKRFILAFLRENSGFHTSRTVTEAWIADRQLRADEATYVILRKRIGAALTTARSDGLLTNGPMEGEYKTWTLA